MRHFFFFILSRVSLFFLSSVVAYDLTSTDQNVLELAWDRIISIAERSQVTSTWLLILLDKFRTSRALSGKWDAMLDYLQKYIADVYQSYQNQVSLTPWSIQEMKQKEFIWTDLVLEEVLNQNAAYTRYRISYNSNWLSISGVMNIPVGEWPFPLVILNHGYIDPAIYTVWRGLKREQDYLARNGYTVLHTDYRNHGLSDSSQDLKDNYYFRSYFYGTDSINAINAVAWLWDDRIDTDNVAMLWHSMGGGVTMHSLLARPDLIDAAVLYAPVHTRERENFERWRREDLSQSELDILTSKIWPIVLDSSFAPYSPDTYLTEITQPLQYYHGTNDKDVPYAWSVESVEKLQTTNPNVELITFENEQHEFWFRRNDFMSGVVEFLDTHLAS